MLNEVTRIQGKPHVRLKSNIVPQQLQQEDPKMGNLHNAPQQRQGGTVDFQKQGRVKHPVGQVKAGEKPLNGSQPQPTAQPTAPVQPTKNDPTKPFIDLAGRDSHMRNDMIAMLGVMYQQKRRDPNSPVKMPDMKTKLPEVELMFQKLFKIAENMSRKEIAVFAKKIQTAELSTKNSTTQSAPQQTQPAQQPQQGNVPATSASTGSMSRLQGLLKQVNPPLTDPQIRAVQHIVNQSKKRKL